MEGPISFWGYKEQESNLILPEHDDDDDDDDDEINLTVDYSVSLYLGDNWYNFACWLPNDGW